MQPSKRIPRGGIYQLPIITRKFDFCLVCNKIPKTTAFNDILTLILDISHIKNIFFAFVVKKVEFIRAKWNLLFQLTEIKITTCISEKTVI